ncbi:sugar ABC transporter substrate-binding protein [Paenibacillus sp. SYP-B3998]|uniref:Sugar ABC transporter substrate-binding protein n=1 Tax=Paenibacillus sp. SYP-B3998 TaxID=2678564 RepID=A0A6G3ZX28_9BACL|nr:sugar ABC transporter substrate-binding protein [Paenibacillus sp. SYP-B3998]NEW06598.1 sugar ABC transporter substrate-binding protein [Paenibacillus sp. SYP-B3998]
MKTITLSKTVVCALFVGSVVSGCSVAPSSNPSSSPTAVSSAGATGEPSKTALDWSKLDDPSLKGKTITVILVDPDGKLTDITKKFTEQTGIKVNVIGVDYNSLYGKITTASLSNSSDIDVIEMDTIWAGQFFKGNIAEDLTTVIPADVLKKYTQSSLDSVIYDKHVVAMPYYSSTKHQYWNKEMLKKAGYDAPPKTLDEFRAMSKKLTQSGIYASGWSWKQAESLNIDFGTIVSAMGGKFVDEKGQIKVNSKEAVAALQYMSDLINVDKTVDPGSLQWTEDDVKNAFAAGKISLMNNWEGMFTDLNDPTKSQVVGKSDMSLIPGQGSVVSAAISGSEGIAIMKSSKNKQAALAFLKWIGSKDFQLADYKEKGVYPALAELYTDPQVIALDESKTIGKVLEQFNYGFNRPNAPGYVEWADILSNQIYSALIMKQTPQQALDEAAVKIDEAIKRAAK